MNIRDIDMNSAKIELLSEKEHLHERKELFIGSCSTVEQDMWIIEDDRLQFKTIPFNEGYFKLISEIIDNSIDEYIKTKGVFGNKISFCINPDLSFEVKDNGRGISHEKDEKTNKPQVELAFCHLKAGSNFKGNKKDQIGANGIGASAVNMMSEYFHVQTIDGKKETTLICSDECEKIKLYTNSTGKKRGTIVSFKINTRHFTDIDKLDYSIVYKYCFKRIVELYTAYPGIDFKFNGQSISKKIWDYIGADGRVVNSGNFFVGMFFKDNENIPDLSYVNGINTYRGGTHLRYFKRTILERIKGKLDKKTKLDIKTSFLNDKLLFVVFLNDFNKAEFSTQNKTELINIEKELKAVISEDILSGIADKFYSSYDEKFSLIIEEIYSKHFEKVSKDVQKNGKNLKKITKFLDANSKNRKDTILFLVEGDSAKGEFENVRDLNKHGIFILKGKPMNAYKQHLKKVLENQEFLSLMSILGLEINKNPSELYFDKIAILSDADVDGNQITILLLLFFYKYFPDLFNKGKIIKVLAPIIHARKKSDVVRFYDYDEYLSKQEEYCEKNGWEITYNKGLGGMPIEEYHEMLHNLRYKEITIQDMEITEKTMQMIFGKNTEIRKDWLTEE